MWKKKKAITKTNICNDIDYQQYTTHTHRKKILKQTKLTQTMITQYMPLFGFIQTKKKKMFDIDFELQDNTTHYKKNHTKQN